jgi:hypothetical protein
LNNSHNDYSFGYFAAVYIALSGLIGEQQLTLQVAPLTQPAPRQSLVLMEQFFPSQPRGQVQE